MTNPLTKPCPCGGVMMLEYGTADGVWCKRWVCNCGRVEDVERVTEAKRKWFLGR